MKLDTAPGITGLTSDMLQALTEKAPEHLTLIIQKFWKGEEDHEVWYSMLMTALYKGKCKTNDPYNWRDLFLKARNLPYAPCYS
jgi:hypothetical protein